MRRRRDPPAPEARSGARASAETRRARVRGFREHPAARRTAASAETSRPIPRRDFLAAASACSPAILLAARAPGVRPPIHAPERIGLQLFTVRSLAGEDMAATLEAVSGAGYDEVEFAGYFGHAPATLRRWLDEAGLAAPAAHVGEEELFGAGLDRTLEEAAVVGHRWLVLPWIPPEQRTPDGYRAAADRLNVAGAAAQTAGMRVAYHNHAFEFEALEPGGPTGWDILLDRLDPAVADMEIDFHWSAAGGADPIALFAAHPGRFALCHLKDMDARGRMTDVGDGDIDWDAIFASSAQAGIVHYFVEHDQPADPLESIRNSFRYLKGRQSA